MASSDLLERAHRLAPFGAIVEQLDDGRVALRCASGEGVVSEQLCPDDRTMAQAWLSLQLPARPIV